MSIKEDNRNWQEPRIGDLVTIGEGGQIHVVSTSDDGMSCLEDFSGSDMGTYPHKDLLVVPNQYKERIEELERKLADARGN